jgi:hypothetical protein
LKHIAYRAACAQHKAESLLVRAHSVLDAAAHKAFADVEAIDGWRVRVDAWSRAVVVSAETTAVLVDAALERFERLSAEDASEDASEDAVGGPENTQQVDTQQVDTQKGDTQQATASLRVCECTLSRLEAFVERDDVHALLFLRAPTSALLRRQLVLAATEGDAALVAILLGDGRVDPRSDDLDACLDFASLHGHADVAAVILQERAHPGADDHGCLVRAAFGGHTAVVALLLQDGRADPAWISTVFPEGLAARACAGRLNSATWTLSNSF